MKVYPVKLKSLAGRVLIILLLLVWQPLKSIAQNSFVDLQKSFSRTAEVFGRREDSLKKEFAAKNLNWPPQSVFLRSFKFEKQLELWVKNDGASPYQLFKTYKICAESGTSGPKRMEGDFQVPEGFYYINDFNPNSSYHLSLGINYPNASDRILSDSLRPGSDIYIHGNCASVGCIAITDLPIEEVYILTSYARGAGQDYIPVHVYPIRYNEKKSQEYLGNAIKLNPSLQRFAERLKDAYNYFEEKKQLPVITVTPKGEYIIN